MKSPSHQNLARPSISTQTKFIPPTSPGSPEPFLESPSKPPTLEKVDRAGLERAYSEEKQLVTLDPRKYEVERDSEEKKCIEDTRRLIQKRDKTLLSRYRSDDHKISRIVMREIRPKNGFDCEKAARFYQETVKWRERYNCEHTLRYPPGKLNVYNMCVPELNYGCFDKEGIPVIFIRIGFSSGKQCFGRLSTQEWAMCHAYDLEMMELMCRQQSKKMGKWVDKIR